MANTLLQAADMVYLRAEAEKALPDICDIQERQNISDGQGGFTEEWAAVYQNVPCRLSELSGRERIIAAEKAVDASWVLTLPFDQSIDETMRVSHNSHSYEAVFVNSDRSHDTARRCLLRKLQ